MKKLIFSLTILLLLCSSAFGARYKKKQIQFLDENYDPVNMGTSVSLYIYNTGGTTEQTCYLDAEGASAVTQPVTDNSTNTPLDYTTGLLTFWSSPAAYKIVATDGTYTRTVDDLTGSITRFSWPSYLTAMSGYALGDSDDLTFGDGLDFALDSDTHKRLDIIPAADGSVLAIGDATYQVDVYMYAGSTSAYWIFDEGNSEVYYQTINLQLDDDADLIFGDGDDFAIDSDTAKTLDFNPAAATDDYIVNFGADQSGVDIKAFGLTTGEAVHWDASADSLTTVGDLALFTLTGTTVPFRVDCTTQVTSGNAIELETSDGPIQILADGGTYGTITIDAEHDLTVTTTAAAADIIIDSTLGSILIDSGENAASAISLITNTGSSETIVVTNTKGTGAGSIALVATAGGITAKVCDEKELKLGNAGLDAYFIVAASATAGNEDVRIVNTNGTDNAAIALTATAGGITAAVADEKELKLGNAGADAYFIVAASATAGNEDVRIVNTNGTDDASIELASAAGGITLNAAAGSIDIEAVGGTDGDLLLSAGDILTVTHVDKIIFDGAAAETWEVEGTADDYETTVVFTDPTADATVTVPTAQTGTLMLAGANSEIYSIVVEVTAAQIKGLAGAQKELVAAPGSGYGLKLLSCLMILDNGGTNYDDAAADGNMYICYVDGNGLKATGSIEGDAFIDCTADFIIAVEPADLAATAATSIDNDALVLDNDGAEYTTGDGTMTVFITYAKVNLGL